LARRPKAATPETGAGSACHSMVSLIKYFEIHKKQALKAIKTVVFYFCTGLRER
jgi:hypothetical protein